MEFILLIVGYLTLGWAGLGFRKALNWKPVLNWLMFPLFLIVGGLLIPVFSVGHLFNRRSELWRRIVIAVAGLIAMPIGVVVMVISRDTGNGLVMQLGAIFGTAALVFLIYHLNQVKD